ncbi:MAG: hypothetical protein LBH80_03900 [Prevotellaceae bacterium]|nr:hypothetical protein [Prevotellaceae bacterium]
MIESVAKIIKNSLHKENVSNPAGTKKQSDTTNRSVEIDKYYPPNNVCNRKGTTNKHE